MLWMLCQPSLMPWASAPHSKPPRGRDQQCKDGLAQKSQEKGEGERHQNSSHPEEEVDAHTEGNKYHANSKDVSKSRAIPCTGDAGEKALTTSALSSVSRPILAFRGYDIQKNLNC
mmetsp:Transcript_37295/g.89179  ORF Transcript_37295/g.89179 Transcript_37295/m.89179 type:complete len:116 (+) Transcript_37295:1095-1442(+)